MNHITQRRVTIKTELTQDMFEQLHADVAKARETTKMAYVDKVAVQTLLRDYSRLIDRLEKIEKDEGLTA
jgi:hypothetical protein